MAVAERMFAAEGYDAVSTKGIALASGLTIGALYHHFVSKDALYRAVMEEALAKLAPAPAQLFEETGTAEDQLLGLIGWFSRTIAEAGHPAALLRRELLEPRLAIALGDIAIFQAPLGRFRSLMKRLAPNADIAFAEAAIISLSFGLTNLGGLRRIVSSIGKIPEEPDAIAQAVSRLILRGLD